MELRDDLNYWQVIELPDGTVTPGKADHRKDPALLNLEGQSILRGARVLDIAANDGYWSYWAEQQGASDVLAVDVERYEDYDWSYGGPPVGWHTKPGEEKDQVFRYLHGIFGSKVRREACSVYNLDAARHGEFDLVFMYGLLYHLRHPLLAIDKMRQVCRGAVIIETHVVLASADAPVMVFYEDNVLDRAISNWCGPTPSCVAHWMRSAGFEHVYIQRDAGGERYRFLGAITPEWKAIFDGSPNFRYCDEAYFAHAHEVTAQLTGRGTSLSLELSRDHQVAKRFGAKPAPAAPASAPVARAPKAKASLLRRVVRRARRALAG